MRDAQKPDHISLNTLLSRLKEGRFVIPYFQREFEWNPWDIRDLIRSIYVDDYQELHARMEFADLRELQEIIISKATWSMFQDQFANKEALITKFGQLAELRNGIRHSRRVDEITLKEGEAAILWFEQVLKK
ncbi:MAG: hypothetical protein GY725_01750 [bacterium]|nr:hypothetical protein [bacterium]